MTRSRHTPRVDILYTFAAMSLLFCLLSPLCAAAPAIDRFNVDAAVGGVVRRDLREIGKAALQYVALPNAFRLRGNARVENREKHKIYRFSVDMTFRAGPRRLEVLEDKSVFEG